MRYQIPRQVMASGSYWCTWGIQNSSQRGDITDPTTFEVDGFRLAMDHLDEALLFHQPGWANAPFGEVQRDLFVVYDVGWDVPVGVDYPRDRWRLGSVEIDTARFPSCTGTPPERLRKLNALTQAAGWRGAGLWIAPQVVGDRDDALHINVDAEAYWRERARWSAEAGIGYWKVDIGARSLVPNFRAMLTQIAHEEAPVLLVEHGRNTGPLNDVPVPWENIATNGQGRFATWGAIPGDSLGLVAQSDVFRTYDVTGQLSTATTLDRVAHLLGHAAKGGLLNCEDEVTLGAVLGCTFGVMRHPMSARSAILHEDPLELWNRIDEVRRAVRWQRIAPPVAAGTTPFSASENVLVDAWHFTTGDTWAGFVNGKTIEQKAPAVVARGMPLPWVVPLTGDNEVPFVVAMRHPNGVHAIATLPRTREGAIVTPLSTVTMVIDTDRAPIAVFGKYHALTLECDALTPQTRVWAQDIAGNQTNEITGSIDIHGNQMTLSGDLIARIGLSAATPGDQSDPGLVLTWEAMP